MLEEIEAIIQENIRPQLASHGGDIRVLSLTGGVLRFELLGQCSGCPSASLTTEELVKVAIMGALPEIKDVVLLEHMDETLLAQARAILGRHRKES